MGRHVIHERVVQSVQDFALQEHNFWHHAQEARLVIMERTQGATEVGSNTAMSIQLSICPLLPLSLPLSLWACVGCKQHHCIDC